MTISAIKAYLTANNHTIAEVKLLNGTYLYGKILYDPKQPSLIFLIYLEANNKPKGFFYAVNDILYIGASTNDATPKS